MSDLYERASGATSETSSTHASIEGVAHPLEPLTAEEITAAVAIVRTERQLGESTRFISVNLQEPAKELVLNFHNGEPIERQAFMVLLDYVAQRTYEARVSISQGKVMNWRELEGVQPAIIPEELAETEALVKANPDFQAALKRRGITDLELVMIDTWSPGYYESDELQQRRLLRSFPYMRYDNEDNGYAHPIEGIVILVDLNAAQVVRIDDYDVLPVPPQSGKYTPDAVGPLRTDLKPIEITQPEGTSFSVDGHEISWQKWRFRITFNTREGLVLHTVSYNDGGRERPVLYRASIAEMVVPYGDPGNSHYRKNAFDVGEYGLGTLANALELGCDCLGDITYFDALMTDGRGELQRLPNAICMHEEDYGILWKHYDWRANRTEVRRSRRLVVSFIATIDNYEYGFYWYFYQDGTIECEVKLTGIMSTGAVAEGYKPKHGTLVAPQLTAPNHQHIFSVRLDMMVDGLQNSVYEVHTESEPMGPENPYGNAFFAKATLLKDESEAQQIIDPLSCRYWKISNPNVQNELGEAVAYKLMPGSNTLPFAHPESSVMKRAGFAGKNLWVTRYAEDEKYPAGDYPNQHPGGAGLPEWTRANRSIVDTDVVLWYSMNINHIPSPEDWPVMPAHYINFMLKPAGFFNRSAALDIPPSEACDMDHHEHGHEHHHHEHGTAH
jgi:primary-amine oxidase